MTHEVSPHSIEAEQAVLGSILLENDNLDLVASQLTPEQFFRTAHQVIFRAMLTLRLEGQQIDHVTVHAALTRAGTSEAADGPVYLINLLDGRVRGLNVPSYVRTVRDLAAKRALIKTGHALIREAHEADASADVLIDAAQAQLLALAQQDTTRDLVAGQQLATDAIAWLDEVAARRQQGRMSGVSTGLVELDNMTDGLQPGDLILIACRPSQGKTALALQFALGADGPTAFFSLEMRRSQLAARALAWLARVDGWALRRGMLTKLEYERVSHALEALGTSGLAIDDASELSVWQLRSKARRWQAQHGLRLIVVDYLQLMTPATDKRKQTNREQEVAAMSRSLKGLAKELSVPVIALSQLNRAIESRGADKPPTLADLRESGALEQDADLVMFLHRPAGMSVKDEGEAHLIVAKHRNGPTGTVPLFWIPSQTRFTSQGQV